MWNRHAHPLLYILLVQKEDGSHTAVVQFVNRREAAVDEESLCEVIFLIDRSGSMAGAAYETLYFDR